MHSTDGPRFERQEDYHEQVMGNDVQACQEIYGQRPADEKQARSVGSLTS